MARTTKEKFLAALRGEAQDELLITPNLEYYYNMHKLRGTLPEKYRDMSYNDMLRAIHSVVWRPVVVLKKKFDKSIKFTEYNEKGKYYQKYETPLGEVWQEWSHTEDEFSSRAVTKHFITDLETLKIMTYVVEGTGYEENFDYARQVQQDVGDDGVVLCYDLEVPFIRYAKRDAGYETAFYLWSDYPDEVERIVEAYSNLSVEMVRLQRNAPVDIIHCNDDLDEVTFSPSFFQQYAVPFYKRMRQEVEGSGKLFETHWCGRTPHLLPLAKDVGLQAIEAVATEPFAKITLDEALNTMEGKVTLQCGVPAIYLCPSAYSDEEYDRYMLDVVRKQKGRPGFIASVSDSVPPDADIARLERMYSLLND